MGVKESMNDLKKINNTKDKTILLEEYTKEKMDLTENQKKVFYSIIKYPLFNDIELSEELKIKRSTITAIRNKLKRDNFYSCYRIPSFSLIGCELLTIMYGKLNPMTRFKLKKFNIFRETSNAPEQVYLNVTNKEVIGICISKNFTELKTHIDNLIRKYKEYDLIEDISLVQFPLEISKFEKLFEHNKSISNTLNLNVREKPIELVNRVKRKLTDK